MTRKSNTLLIIVVVLMILLAGRSHAQDATAVPTDEPVSTTEPVDTVVTTTTTTTAPADNIGLTINWALAFLMLWQAAGIAYAVTVEKSIKPVLYSVAATFTTSEPARNALLIVAVFIGAVVAVNTGGINLFADAPFGLFSNASPGFLLVLNSLFVAAGAFMGHEIWTTLEAYLKKAKAIADVLRPPEVEISSVRSAGGMSQ